MKHPCQVGGDAAPGAGRAGLRRGTAAPAAAPPPRPLATPATAPGPLSAARPPCALPDLAAVRRARATSSFARSAYGRASLTGRPFDGRVPHRWRRPGGALLTGRAASLPAGRAAGRAGGQRQGPAARRACRAAPRGVAARVPPSSRAPARATEGCGAGRPAGRRKTKKKKRTAPLLGRLSRLAAGRPSGVGVVRGVLRVVRIGPLGLIFCHCPGGRDQPYKHWQGGAGGRGGRSGLGYQRPGRRRASGFASAPVRGRAAGTLRSGRPCRPTTAARRTTRKPGFA